MAVERHVSAGGVVYRNEAGQIMLAICGRNSPKLWALPKGTPKPGESIEQTAVREVSEETGLEVEIRAPVGSVNYWFRAEGYRINKTVHFFLMSVKGGSTALHDAEFDWVEWFSPEQTLQHLSYKSEAQIVQKALESLGDERVIHNAAKG
jgi:8-oxo-dGTP pyrophosphatase MutT (NUDIX family)